MGGAGLRMISVFRILRLFRLVRLLRIFKMFNDLYTVVCAFGSSLQSIMWVTILLVLGLFFCAILVTQMLGQNAEYSELVIGDEATIRDRFGTVSKSVFSLFELLTMEGWTDIGRPLVNKSPWLIMFFIAFFMIFSFGLMSMIVGLVVDHTIQYSQTNDFTVEQEKRNKKREIIETLKAFFLASDADGDGMLTLSELREGLENNEQIRQALERVDVPADMWRDFFDVLDKEQQGQVTVEQFLKGIDRLRGEARSKDLVASQIVISQIQKSQEVLLHNLDEMELEQQEVLDRLYKVEHELTSGKARCLTPRPQVNTVSKLPPSTGGSSSSCDTARSKVEVEPEPAPHEMQNPLDDVCNTKAEVLSSDNLELEASLASASTMVSATCACAVSANCAVSKLCTRNLGSKLSL